MQRGFVLGMVLIVLLILSMIALQLLQSGLLESRMGYSILRVYQTDAVLVAGLQKGLSQVVNDNNGLACWYSARLRTLGETGPAQWWQGVTTCQGNLDQHEYHYVIELLDSPFSCVHYYQVTSYVSDPNPRWLQATVLVTTAMLTDSVLDSDYIQCPARSDDDDMPNLPLKVALLSWHRVDE